MLHFLNSKILAKTHQLVKFLTKVDHVFLMSYLIKGHCPAHYYCCWWKPQCQPLMLLPLHGCCSYLSKLSAWSSSQFRVTLLSHAWLESNLLCWKDKETLIEILASGHLALSFHMGLDKLFSSCLVVHAVFDPSFTTKQRAHLNPHGACDSDQDVS